FVMQPGVPLVTVNASCSGGKQTLELSQQRFLLSSANDGAKQSQIWSIPICTKTARAGSSCYLVDKQDARFTANTCTDWIFANRDAKGYYRVHYPSLKSLKDIGTIAEKDLTVPERIAFVEDLWAMVRAGKEPVENFLTIVPGLRTDHNRLVVDSIAGH